MDNRKQGETMPDQETKERIDQEVVSANHDKLYQATKKEVDDHELKATAQRVRDNGLGLSKETQDKMVEYIKTNSKAKLQDVIKEFFSK